LCFVFGSLTDSGAELLKGMANAIALNRAELPGSDAESLLNDATVLELINELVENLARLRGLHADKGGGLLALINGKVSAIKGGYCDGINELALLVLASVDMNGNLLTTLEHIREAHGRARGLLSIIGYLWPRARGSSSASRTVSTTRRAVNRSASTIGATRVTAVSHARIEVTTTLEVTASIVGAKRDRSPHGRSISYCYSATSEALNLCLKGGNGGVLLGDPHLEVSELGKEYRGVINNGVHLGIACNNL
jgi:hypothetical protein